MIQVNQMPSAANVRIAYDDRYPFRILDAWGDVQKNIIDGPYRAADFTVTATGTSPVTASVLPGAVALITTAATEYAGDNIQALGSQFKLAAGKPAYFGAKITVSDATQSDLLVGLFGVDTALTAASTAHAIDVGAGGIGFTKLDGATQVYAKTFTAAVEKNSASTSTLDTDPHVYEMYWDGAALNCYVDAALVACFRSNVTTEVLTPSVCFRAGEAVAKTCTIHWIRAVQAL